MGCQGGHLGRQRCWGRQAARAHRRDHRDHRGQLPRPWAVASRWAPDRPQTRPAPTTVRRRSPAQTSACSRAGSLPAGRPHPRTPAYPGTARWTQGRGSRRSLPPLSTPRRSASPTKGQHPGGPPPPSGRPAPRAGMPRQTKRGPLPRCATAPVEAKQCDAITAPGPRARSPGARRSDRCPYASYWRRALHRTRRW